MSFEIHKREFLKGLSIIQSVTGRKTTLPILSHILMEWDKNSLYLTGTDLETGIREELSAIVQQSGKASVSAKKIYEIVRDDVGDLRKRRWGIEQDKNRFTQTAQSKDALGDSARHAAKKYKPPLNPMSLAEAKSFIRNILLNWLH